MYRRVLRDAQRQISLKSLRIASDGVYTLENFGFNIKQNSFLKFRKIIVRDGHVLAFISLC